MWFLLAVLGAALRWLQGWGALDDWQLKEALRRVVAFSAVNPADAPAWRKVADKLTSTGVMAAAFGVCVFACVAHGGASMVVAMSVAANCTALYWACKAAYSKRVLFVNWNANPETLQREDAGVPGVVLSAGAWVAARIKPACAAWYKPDFENWHYRAIQNYATAYGTVAGACYALAFSPMYVHGWVFADLPWFAGLCLLFPMLYGAIYRAASWLPDPIMHGESVGRACFGVCLGLAIAGAA